MIQRIPTEAQGGEKCVRDDNRGLRCSPLPGGPRPLQSLYHHSSVTSFFRGQVRPPGSLLSPHSGPESEGKTWGSSLGTEKASLLQQLWEETGRLLAAGLLGWSLAPPCTSLRAPGPGVPGATPTIPRRQPTPLTAAQLRYTQPIPERQDDGPEEKERQLRGCTWRLKSPQFHVAAAPRICPPEGTCLEEGLTSDVTARPHPGLPGTKVTHRARLAASRCGLGPWNEAKAHAATEWPWPPSAGLQRHSTPPGRPKRGCQVWASTGAESTRWGGWKLWNLAGSQPSSTLDTPFRGLIPKIEKNALHIRLLLCNLMISLFLFFSICQQVKCSKDTGPLFKYED